MFLDSERAFLGLVIQKKVTDLYHEFHLIKETDVDGLKKAHMIMGKLDLLKELHSEFNLAVEGEVIETLVDF